MGLPMRAETKRRLAEDDRRWHVKFTLRAIATLFSFISLVIFATTVNESTQNYGGNDWVDGMPITPLLLSLIYNPLKIFLTITYRHGKQIHPGWDVAVDLLIWALAIPSIIFSVGDGWFWWWQPVYLEFDNLIPCDGFNYWSKPCNPLIYTLGRMEIAANVFLGLVLVIHFVLFVFACIATHRVRMASKRAGVESRNIALQYNRSPEEHLEQQPPAYTRQPHIGTSALSDGDVGENPFASPEDAAVKYA